MTGEQVATGEMEPGGQRGQQAMTGKTRLYRGQGVRKVYRGLLRPCLDRQGQQVMMGKTRPCRVQQGHQVMTGPCSRELKRN